MTAEMPEVAASLWHRFCGSLHQRMVKVRTNIVASAGSTAVFAYFVDLLLVAPPLLLHSLHTSSGT